MNTTKAIQILSDHYQAPYVGSSVDTITGNLVEDIMNEGDEGKTFHKWATTPLSSVVEESNLISLAKHYS